MDWPGCSECSGSMEEVKAIKAVATDIPTEPSPHARCCARQAGGGGCVEAPALGIHGLLTHG